MTIKLFIDERMTSGKYIRQYELAMELGIQSSLLSHYRTGRAKQPTLEVAVKVYLAHEVVLWPYAESVIKELSNV